MSEAAVNAPESISPPGRRKRIFVNVLILHAMALSVPLLLDYYHSIFDRDENVFEINIVDTPSVGPVTGPRTTQKPSPPEPMVKPPPEPTPPEPLPPDPTPPPPTPPPPVKEPVVADLPFPTPKAVKEPTVKLPPVRRTDDRSLNTKKAAPPAPSKPQNKFVPVGKDDVAQTLGEKPSNTPQGGKQTEADYNSKLKAYLMALWAPPSRAEIGDIKPVVLIEISISGTGMVTSSRIVKPSGVAAMDAKVRQFLSQLKQVPIPDDGKPRTGIQCNLVPED
jgi:TonB family protein